MEEGFAKKGSFLSSSSSWASRLSPLAQPFTMTRQSSQSQALNSLTNSSPSKPLAPSTSNHLDQKGDFRLSKSFSNLINLEDDKLFVSSDSALSASAASFDSHNQLEFGTGVSHFQGFRGPSIGETGLVGSTFSHKSSVSTHTRKSLYGIGSSHLESLPKQDSKVTSFNISAAPDVSNIAPMFGSSITNSTSLPSSHVLPSTVHVIGLSNNDNSYGGKEDNQDEGLLHSRKEINVVKSVSGKGFDRLMVAKSECNVTSEDVSNGLALKNYGAVAGVSTQNPVKSLNNNEDDLDSPCWKGFQNSGKPFGRVSEPVHRHQNQSEASPSLNPEAPQFIPSHAKGVAEYSQNNFVGDGLTSFGENERPCFSPSPKDPRLVDSHKAGPKPPEFSHATGYRQSSGVYESSKDPFTPNNTNTSSVLNSSQLTRPRLVNRISPDHSHEGFIEGTRDSSHNIEANFPSIDTENIPSFSRSGVGSLNEFSEVLQNLSQSLSSCPNINVSMMVKAIHYLSESLVQNYANDFDLLNDHDHDMIRDIINYLNVPFKHRIGGKTPILGLSHTGRLDYHSKSTAIHEPSNIDFQLTRSKDLVVCCEPDNHRWGQSYSHFPSKKMQDLASTSKDVRSETGNGVFPDLRTALNRQIDEQFHPQALLKLWIEAQAALCSMKYENHILRMKLQADGCGNEQI